MRTESERNFKPLSVRGNRLLGRDWAIAYPFVFPMLAVLLGLVAYPFFSAIWLSLTSTTIGSPGSFIGLANYAQLLNDRVFANSVFASNRIHRVGRRPDGRIAVMSFQNHLHRLRPLRPDVEPRFYVYFLQSAFTQLGIFEGAGNQTTIPNLSRNRLAALVVPHPHLEEQRAIAYSLLALRQAIEVHAAATARAHELRAATMNQVFLRGLHGEAQKETELGPMPESWAAVRLGDVCSLAT